MTIKHRFHIVVYHHNKLYEYKSGNLQKYNTNQMMFDLAVGDEISIRTATPSEIIEIELLV